jgi:signal transduction histidine kinase
MNRIKAKYFLSKSLKISRNIGDKQGLVYNLQTLAYDYCLMRNDYNKAEKYAVECRKVAEEYGGTKELISAWTVLAYVYLYQKRYEECKTFLLKAYNLSPYDISHTTLTTLAAAYFYLGELDEAYNFFQEYVFSMEENAGKQFQRTLANIEAQYETEKKEMRIDLLEKERQLYIWLSVAGILLTFVLIIVLWQKIKSAKREKQLIATRSVLDGEMKERTRLAQDLHDRLSGNLSAIKIELGGYAESLQNIRNKLDNCIIDIRNVAHNLMPASLQFGLKVALEDFSAQFKNLRFYFFGEEKRIEERLEFVVYCCANELVNNSIKHSGAKNINMQLVQDKEHVSLTVSDDGCGFDEKAVIKGFGLKSIRDRVASCNGKIDVDTFPGKGTETTIEIKTSKL